MYTRLLIGNSMSCWRLSCFKLMKTTRDFCAREGTSLYTRTLGKMQLLGEPNVSTLPNCSSARSRFGFDPVPVLQRHSMFRRCKAHSRHIYTVVQTIEFLLFHAHKIRLNFNYITCRQIYDIPIRDPLGPTLADAWKSSVLQHYFAHVMLLISYFLPVRTILLP